MVYQNVNLGYTLYVRSEVDEALPCFQQCLGISQGQDKAAALNMLGCCCALKVRSYLFILRTGKMKINGPVLKGVM